MESAEKSTTRVVLELAPGFTTGELIENAHHVRMLAYQAWGHPKSTAPDDLGWRSLRERLAKLHDSGLGYGAIATAVNSWLQGSVQRRDTDAAEMVLKACGFGPRRVTTALEEARCWNNGRRLSLWSPVTDEDVKQALRKPRGTRAPGGGLA